MSYLEAILPVLITGLKLNLTCPPDVIHVSGVGGEGACVV